MANAHGRIIANVDRLHRLMDEEGVSAIVARSGKNFTYLAGFAYPGPWPGTWNFRTRLGRCCWSGPATGSPSWC